MPTLRITASTITGRQHHSAAPSEMPQISAPSTIVTGSVIRPYIIPRAKASCFSAGRSPIPTGRVKVMVQPSMEATTMPAKLPISGSSASRADI